MGLRRCVKNLGSVASQRLESRRTPRGFEDTAVTLKHGSHDVLLSSAANFPAGHAVQLELPS